MNTTTNQPTPHCHRLKAELDRAVQARTSQEMESAAYVAELRDANLKLSTEHGKLVLANDRVTQLEIQVTRLGQERFGVSENERALSLRVAQLEAELLNANKALKEVPGPGQMKELWSHRLETWRNTSIPSEPNNNLTPR
jgi:hypothetical protein